MINLLKKTMLCFLCLAVLTGLLYPLTVTGLAQVFFSAQANGSLIRNNNEIVASNLIGQNFASPKYFHGRPSAAGKDGYDAVSSSGSNLGPTSKKLLDNVKKRIEQVREENYLSDQTLIPGDLVTASASGLDPHISPASAYLQANRIAKVRGLNVEKVTNLVKEQTLGRQLGLFGEPRVNVVQLNLALDKL